MAAERVENQQLQALPYVVWNLLVADADTNSAILRVWTLSAPECSAIEQL